MVYLKLQKLFVIMRCPGEKLHSMRRSSQRGWQTWVLSQDAAEVSQSEHLSGHLQNRDCSSQVLEFLAVALYAFCGCVKVQLSFTETCPTNTDTQTSGVMLNSIR